MLNLIKCYCVKIYLFSELRVLPPLKRDLEASWLFLFLVIKGYIVAGEEKRGNAEFQCHFFVPGSISLK